MLKKILTREMLEGNIRMQDKNRMHWFGLIESGAELYTLSVKDG